MHKPSYQSRLLIVLMLVLATNKVDNIALGLLLQGIKTDLGLTDSQLGLLTGIASTLLFAVMGLPLARWSDRGHRGRIISACVALWGASVMTFGMVTTLAQAISVRMMTAVGEAGCMPAALSLITDQFGRAERPRAVSRFLLGTPIAAIVGAGLAGWWNEHYGWRAAFVIIGAPGLVLALTCLWMVGEPRQAAQRSEGIKPAVLEPVPPLGEVIRTLAASRTYAHLLLCYALNAFFASGIQVWQPTFFIRTYGMGTAELGAWLALAYGFGGLIGTYLGGELASRLAPSDEGRQLRGLALLYLLIGVVKASIYLVTGSSMAIAMMIATVILGAMGGAPLTAAVQTIVPSNMRATATATILFFSNLLGLGLGPTLVGILSDAWNFSLGADSLRYAILAMCPGYLWIAAHAWVAGGRVSEASRERTAQ